MQVKGIIFWSALLAGASVGCGSTIDTQFGDSVGGGGAGGAGGGSSSAYVPGMATSTSSGSGGACEPGATLSCYTGPAGTEGVGPCSSGFRTCSSDGAGYGPCEGEVVPAPAEDCSTPQDDDCNGVAFEPQCLCIPGTRVACYDGPDGTEGVGICIGGFSTCEPSGLAYSACVGEVVPKKEDCSTPADEDCSGPIDCGTVQWKVQGTPALVAVALDPQGNIFVAGATTASVNLGDQTWPNAGGTDVLVAKYDANGHVLWSRVFGDAKDQSPTAIAVDSQGNVVITGMFEGSLNFGDRVLTNESNYPLGDIFVAKFDGDGNIRFSASYTGGANSSAEVNAVAIGPGDRIALAGEYGGPLDFGDGALPPNNQGGGGFVAIFEPSGVLDATVPFVGIGDTDITGVVFDNDGEIFAGGFFDGSTTVDGTTLVSAGGRDAFLAHIDANGSLVWAAPYGDAEDQLLLALAITPSGEPVVAIQLTGTIVLGRSITSEGSSDVVIAQLDRFGNARWAQRFGDAGEQSVYNIAVDSAGEVMFTAADLGMADFGGGYQIDPVVKLSATGEFIWEVGLPDGSWPGGLAADAHGNAIIVGANENGFEFVKLGR